MFPRHDTVDSSRGAGGGLRDEGSLRGFFGRLHDRTALRGERVRYRLRGLQPAPAHKVVLGMRREEYGDRHVRWIHQSAAGRRAGGREGGKIRFW